MCRLYGFRANESTKVDCSLVFAQNALLRQSQKDQAGHQHSDGWGIAYYENGKPILKKRTSSAFEDAHFSMTAEQSYSQTVVAHVRLATVGRNALNNTHPFVHSNLIFAHNGTIPEFSVVREYLQSETKLEYQRTLRGETDSEQYFLWLLSRLNEQLDSLHEQSVLQTISQAIVELAEYCKKVNANKTPRLNFVLTDGRSMIACRWNRSLHWIARRGIYDCEICGIPHIHHGSSVEHRAIAIASEPVTHEKWSPLPNYYLMQVTPELDRRTLPINDFS